jgi:Tfp pilus assembly protein PilO
MKTTDRVILGSVLLLVLVGAFWMLVLSPKRKEASEVAAKVDQLEQQISEAEQVADFANEARQQFPKYYGRMVVLGKAVPDQADSASLLVQLSKISQSAGVEFQQIALAAGGSGTAAPAAPTGSAAEAAANPSATDVPGGESGEASSTTEASSATTGTAVPAATESTAATLPIGASIGTAGLGTLPYNLTFNGQFFDVADFIDGMDALVDMKRGQLAPDGRLLTIDGFALTADPEAGFPKLQASFLITTYSTPSDQGLTLGATPSGPAPTIPQTTPTSAVVTP